MVGEEVSGLAEVVTQGAHAQNLARLAFDGLPAVLPDDLQHLVDAGLEVQRMARVIYQDAVPRNLERIIPAAFLLQPGHIFPGDGQTLLVLELAGRTDRQRRERVGQLRCRLLARGKPDVPAAESAAMAQ